MKRRLLALLLALVITFVPAAGVYAEEEGAPDSQEEILLPRDPNQNAEVEARRLELEKKYGITIRYDTDADGAASIGTGSLHVLDSTLAAITPQVVSQVSAYMQKTRGSRLAVSFVYSPFQSMGYSFDVLGSFEPETAIIELYIPAYGKDVAMTGDSPLTIAHEFGHAFHQMLMEKYGGEKLSSEWTALNEGARYIGPYLTPVYDDTVFISGYGSTSYDEDFAEVFAHSFVRHKDGLGFGYLLEENGAPTPLGRKVSLIKKLLPLYISNTEQAVSNLGRVYSASPYLEYGGLKIGGEDLQFMGCAYPRYILRSIQNEMRLESLETQWIIEIGAWQVKATNGETYLIFPGGAWLWLARPLDLAA